MIDMLKRHEIQVLRRAAHTWREIAALSGVPEKTARRIATENPVTTVDNEAERARRQVGRPSKAEAYRDVLVHALTEDPGARNITGDDSRVLTPASVRAFPTYPSTGWCTRMVIRFLMVGA